VIVGVTCAGIKTELLDGPEVSTPDERVSVGTIETELLPDTSEPFADE
jgi:hypothetical protein